MKKFDLSRKTLLQSVIDTLECGDQLAKDVIDELINAGEEFTEKSVTECAEYLEHDGRA